MTTETILLNTFFAFWHSVGDWYLLIWEFAILAGIVTALINYFMKK